MEEAVPAWRGWRRGGGGGGVEEKAVAWKLGNFNMREIFVFCIFNFIYLTNLTVKLLF